MTTQQAQPKCLPEGALDYSCPYSSHNLLGVDPDDVRRMRCVDNHPNAYLSDNCIRAILTHNLPADVVSKKIALFDPQWLASWRYMDLANRLDQYMTAFPRPLARYANDEAITRIVLPFCRNAHWMLIVLHLLKKEIVVYDSMRSKKNTDACVSAAKAFGEVFYPWLGGTEDWFSEWSVRGAQVMQQKDGVSCGVFCILNTLVVVQGEGLEPEFVYPEGGLVDVKALRRWYGHVLWGMV